MPSVALKVRKGTPTGGGMMPAPTGLVPTVIVTSTVLVAVSITETLLE
jgi:hypothetical protein